MYLQQILKSISKDHLPKHVNIEDFVEEHKPIEHKKPSDNMKFQLEETSMFKQNKSPKKKILKDHDIFKNVSNPKLKSKDMSNKNSNGRNNRKNSKKSKCKTPDTKKLHYFTEKANELELASSERRRQKTAEYINKLHTSYKYTKHK